MRVVLFLILGLLTSCTFASQNKVPMMYQLVAVENRIPPKLFYALILNESRSQTSGTDQKKVLPWPWTVNHRGQPHYFPSREEAYLFTKGLVDRGDKWFDVGLGQLNWRWQEQRFDSLWEAFDPYTNLSAAAQHFREQYERPECGSWELAVGCYHRPGQRAQDKERARNYMKKVILLWEKI
jgi:hypothetical protein